MDQNVMIKTPFHFAGQIKFRMNKLIGIKSDS